MVRGEAQAETATESVLGLENELAPGRLPASTWTGSLARLPVLAPHAGKLF